MSFPLPTLVTGSAPSGGVFVAHDRVPGRARLRAPALKARAALGPLLQAELRIRPGVRDVQVNAVTGSVLIEFDPQRVTTAQLVRWTERFSGWGGPTLGYSTGPGLGGPETNGRPAANGRAKRAGSSPNGRSRGPRTSSLDARAAQSSPSSSPPSEGAIAVAQHWARRSVADAFGELESNPGGLSSAVVARRRARYGPNRLPEVDRRSAAQILRDQLVSVPTLMLVGAVGLSLATGGVLDAVVIAAVLALNGGIGFGTERYAEGAIRALQRLGSPRATVVREGRTRDIAGADVVVGDVVRLRPGDLVPADGRVIEAHALSIDEAPLTGESVPVSKIPEPISPPTAIGDCRNLVFMGTGVATGHGRALITSTGEQTQIGRITALVGHETAPRTRMQDGLDGLAKQLGLGTGAVCAGMFALGVALGLPTAQMLQTAVALAISAVPEGLPAVATTALAVGMARLLRRQVVIRRLAAVEALGGVTVLCVDKTGTLTLNRMQVVEVRVDGQFQPFQPPGNWGIGRVPTGTPPPMPGISETLRLLLEVGALCNEADLELGSRGLRIRGSSTEGALLLAAQNAGIDTAALREAYPLSDIRHRETGSPVMATLHERWDGRFRLCVKGAPETVLAGCDTVLVRARRVPLSAALRRQVLAANEAMAARGLRVLGYAEAVQSTPAINGRGEERLTWLGLTGMEDPLRPGVAASIAHCRQAGIRTVILTGDHPATAAAVARALGITEDGEERVAEASALLGLPPAQLRETVGRVDVYARVSPEDKLRIVRALQANGQVVAMTGDGVNDGPAMKAADVGIAMGGQGTEVAKEIADMVLLADNFDQIVAAIEQGRTIYGNIRRALRYLLATNIGDLITVGTALLLRLPIPLSALQMLWMNLISDVVPGLALTLEPPPPEVMLQPPRPPDEPLIPSREWRVMSRDAVTMATSTLVTYRWAIRQHGEGLTAQSVAFTTSALAEIIYALVCGSPFVPAGERALPRPNGLLLGAVGGTAALQALTVLFPPLRSVLGVTPLDRRDWLAVLLGATVPAVAAATRRPRLETPALPAPPLPAGPLPPLPPARHHAPRL